METVVVFFFILLAVLVVMGPVVFMRLQKRLQEQKNYERALDMVPLLIHMPPISDDTEGNGRDVRDLADENISKAQIVYNIIESTIEKNWKNHFYGQRHFAFEVIGSKGFVYFYAAVPSDMVSVVKQAFVSAYPTARLEEATEHNIFSEVGGTSGIVGGELNLKESFAYPIATYQDTKRDAMQSLLNSLSTLEKEDGAAIQFLFRPADPWWRKQATSLAGKKRKGKDKSMTASVLARQMVTALVKPPDVQEEEKQKKHELSSLDQSIVESMEDKTRYAGFEVTIRLVASSNIQQRSRGILNNMVASFSLFDAPGKNGFKFTAAKDVQELASHYILRYFPYRKKRNILNSVEMATLFHFPDQRNIPTSQLGRQESKQVDGPRNMPEQGLLLGFNEFRGTRKPIRLSRTDRARHMYAVGQTGTGKSTFLENLALQDMLNGDGFAFVDPHGDTVEKLLAMVPKERTEDVIYFSPADMDFPMGLNLFEFHNPDQKDFLIQEAINMLYKLYDPHHQGILGPRYESLFRNAALTVMADPEGGTFIDIPKLFRDPQYVKQKLQYVKDPNVREFWEKEMPQSQRSNEFGDVVSWFVSKFGAFLSNEMMRNIIGQTHSAFNLRDIMDNKKILLVNLSKGRTGELNSKLLGMVFVMKFQAAAMSRSDVPEDDRQDFCLYVDEFQNFSTDSFATIMSEARKYHLNLIVANQFTTQLTEEIRDAVFGNIGTIVSFRIGQNDVEALSRYFQPQFDGDDLLRVPNYNAIVRTMINGVPTQPFSMAELPPLGNPNMKLADALKQLSAAKYGKPKAEVEKVIFDRLATKTPDQKPFGSPFGATPAPGGAARPSFGAGAGVPQTPAGAPAAPFGAPGAGSAFPSPSRPSGGNSFLDEWLAKQRAKAPAPAAAPTRPSPLPATPSAAPAFAPTGPAMTPLSQGAPKWATEPAAAPAFAPHDTTELRIPQDKTQPARTTAALAEKPEERGAMPQDAQPKGRNARRDKQRARTPLTPAAQPEGGNISSDEIDQAEINDIAKELKRNLHTASQGAPKGESGKPVGKTDAPQAKKAVTKPADKPGAKETGPVEEPAAPAATEGTIHLTPRAPQAGPAPDDTIFIDSEGHLRSTEELQNEADDAKPAEIAPAPAATPVVSPAATPTASPAPVPASAAAPSAPASQNPPKQ